DLLERGIAPGHRPGLGLGLGGQRALLRRHRKGRAGQQGREREHACLVHEDSSGAWGFWGTRSLRGRLPSAPPPRPAQARSGNIFWTTATRSFTWDADSWNSFCSSAVSLNSMIFSTPSVPSRAGTPTKYPPTP